MTVTINGTSGLAGTNGSANTPAVQGEDTNTGIFFPAADTVAVATGGAERVRVDSSGNLLMGTTSALSPNAGSGSTELSVKSSVSADLILDNTAKTGGIKWVVGSGSNGTAGTGFFSLFDGTSSTERLRVDSTGCLLVGTNISSFADKFVALSASGTSDTALIQNSNSSTFTNSVLSLGATRTTTNSTFNFLSCVTQNVAFRLHIRDSGNVVNQNNSYGAISDAKVKENITDATPKLDKLNQVRVVNYNLIGEEQKQIGVIAQELEQIFPGMVEETADRDAEGNDLGTTTKAVKYSVFVPMLIKAIQELTARVAELEAK